MQPKVKEYKMDSVPEDQVESMNKGLVIMRMVEIKRIRKLKNIRILEYQEEQRE